MRYCFVVSVSDSWLYMVYNWLISCCTRVVLVLSYSLYQIVYVRCFYYCYICLRSDYVVDFSLRCYLFFMWDDIIDNCEICYCLDNSYCMRRYRYGEMLVINIPDNWCSLLLHCFNYNRYRFNLRVSYLLLSSLSNCYKCYFLVMLLTVAFVSTLCSVGYY